MKNIFSKFSLIFLTLLLIFLFSTTSANAEFNLGIYPPVLKANLKPGRTITQVFRIDNLSSEDQTLITQLIPFTTADQYGNPLLDPKTKASWLSYFSLSNSNIKFDEPFVVKSGSSQQLVVAFHPPEDAYARDHYVALVVSRAGSTSQNTIQGSSILGSIAANILITVNSEEDPSTSVRFIDFSLKKGSFLKIGSLYLVDNITPITLTAIAKNYGDYTTETKGVFRVLDNKNTPLYLQGILPQYLISRTERTLKNQDNTDFYFSPQAHQLGLHHLEISISSPNANASSRIEIFLFPFKIVLGLFLSLALILTGTKALKK